MTGLPVCSGAAAVHALERAGYERVSQRSSHVKLRQAATRRTVIVPLHRELAAGTLRSVLRQANLPISEFRRLLKER